MKIIQSDSLIYRLLSALPIQCSPFQLQHIRVGSDHKTFVAIIWRKF